MTEESKCILYGNNINEQSIEHIIPKCILGKLKSGKIYKIFVIIRDVFS